MHGTNRQRGNDAVDFVIRVKRSSPDLPFLDDLVNSQDSVPIIAAVVRNLDSYAVGQELALGAESCELEGGNRGVGDEEEAGDIEFPVSGARPIRRVKE